MVYANASSLSAFPCFPKFRFIISHAYMLTYSFPRPTHSKYWDRYNIHKQSQKFEAKLLASVAAKALDVELHGYDAFKMKVSEAAEAEQAGAGAGAVGEKEQMALATQQSILSAIAPAGTPPPDAAAATADAADAAAAASGSADTKPPHSSTMIDTYYLNSACRALIKCRRTLKNTYLHAFFLQDEKELTLLQHMQGALEENTERLAELLVRLRREWC